MVRIHLLPKTPAGIAALGGSGHHRFSKVLSGFVPCRCELRGSTDCQRNPGREEEKLSIADFPGFNGVRLSFEMLASIIRQEIPSWRAAIANIAGVYVIVDRATGKQYVGCAYGGVGLWQRWTTYAKTGHGGNKKLRQLLKQKGIDYAQNFQFSLVEVCDINASDDYILSRESHWKDALLTREFGLN
jgi:hypothetical protein